MLSQAYLMAWFFFVSEDKQNADNFSAPQQLEYPKNALFYGTDMTVFIGKDCRGYINISNTNQIVPTFYSKVIKKVFLQKKNLHHITVELEIFFCIF